MTNLDSILKSRDITLPTKVHLVKAMVFCCWGVYGNVCGHAVCGRVWGGLDELLLFSDRPGPLPAACSDSWTGVTNSDAYRTRQVA